MGCSGAQFDALGYSVRLCAGPHPPRQCVELIILNLQLLEPIAQLGDQHR